MARTRGPRRRKPATHISNSGAGSRARAQVAQAAARLMAEHGIDDFHLAKQKAAARLGVHEDLPRNAEIEAALMAHQRIFHEHEQTQNLQRLRRIALEAMSFFREFQPRLVGPVLRGSAGAHTEITLHLFADAAETVEIHLLDHHIPFDSQDRRLREDRETYRDYPGYRFLADETPVDLTVFPEKALRQAPLSPIDGKPMARADLAQVRALLEDA